MVSNELKILYSNIKAAHAAIEKATQSLTQLVDFASKADPAFNLAGVTPGRPALDVNRVFALSEILLPRIAVGFIDEVIAKGPAGPAVTIEVLAGEPIAKEV